jgi:hypothetical protein
MVLKNQGHVRYPFYNASKNETLKIEEKGKNSWETPPPIKVQCIKKKKEERKLLSNFFLHSKMITQKVELLLSKCLGEYVYSLFGGWKVLQIDDPIMYHLSDVIHMDIYVFGPLSLH